MAMLYLVNALVNGHMAVAFAMLLNWSAVGQVGPLAVLGVLFAALAYGAAWLTSSMQGMSWQARAWDTANENTERVRSAGERWSFAPAAFTVLSWACYILPAALR